MASQSKKSQPRQRPAKQPASQKGPADAAVAALAAVSEFVARIVERFGWPGAFVVLLYGFVVRYATPDQKQRIIELYVLGNGIGNAYPIGIMAGIGLLVVVAQHRVNSKQQGVLKAEIRRLASWKTEHQQKSIPSDLHHSEDT